jgi:hypothetical protein
MTALIILILVSGLLLGLAFPLVVEPWLIDRTPLNDDGDIWADPFDLDP